jgi:hypothetical protein
MNFSRFFTAILLLAAAAHADGITMYFTAPPSTDLSYSYSSSGATLNGYSTAIVNGIPNQSVICDDFSHETQMPSSSSYTVDYSTLTGSDPLQYVRFTGTNETRNYEEAAVLLVGFSDYLAAGHATSSGITDYQYAIWNLFDPYNSHTNPSGAQANSNQQALQSSALTIVNAGGTAAMTDYKRLVIYTPTTSYASNQEFLGLDTSVGAPEPSAAPPLALLMGAAWIGVRRRNRRA